MRDFDFYTTFGASTLSSFIAAGLFGFTFLQTYSYFIHRSDNDGIFRKIGVCLLWMFDGLQVIFLVWAIYHYLVRNFFYPEALLDEHWSIPVMWLMAMAGNFLAEAYFASYIWTLSKRNVPLTLFIIAAALGQVASSAVVLDLMIARLNHLVLSTTKSNLLPVALQQVFAGIGNGLITAALCYYNYDPSIGLLRALSSANGIITFAIDRGVLCTIFQVVYLFVYVAHDQTFLWLPFHVASSKLLVNALLAQLNGRECGKAQRASLPGSFSLSQLGTRVPMKEGVLVVTTKTVDGDVHSTRTGSTRTARADPSVHAQCGGQQPGGRVYKHTSGMPF